MDGALYIVAGKPTRDLAEYLEALVDASALPVAGDRTQLWTVRDWLHEGAALTAQDRVVFVGAADAWADETAGGAVRFDRFGAQIIVKGAYALLTASERAVDGRKERRAFLDWLRADFPALGEGELAALEDERRIALFDSLRAAINPFGTVLEQQITPPPSSIDLGEAGRLQYKALAQVFVRDVLPEML